MIKRLILYGLFLMIAMAASFFVGVKAERHFDMLTRIRVAMAGFDYSEVHRDMKTADALVYNDVAPIPCPKSGERTFVFVAIGQSNAANYVGTRHNANPKVVSFFEGKCYPASDPLPGASGDRGSIWSRLGDEILASGRYDAVVIAAAAVGGSSVAKWAPKGIFNPLLTGRVLQLEQQGFHPNAFIFQQGELEGHIKGDLQDYKSSMEPLLKQLIAYGGVTYVAITSDCGRSRNEGIRATQKQVAFAMGAKIGVDMDAFKNRINMCHLSGDSADQVAREWRKIILKE